MSILHHDITQYSKASVFAKIGKKTECLLRFSTVAGERGAADAERDVRGFALKCYTDEGNWDRLFLKFCYSSLSFNQLSIR